MEFFLLFPFFSPVQPSHRTPSAPPLRGFVEPSCQRRAHGARTATGEEDGSVDGGRTTAAMPNHRTPWTPPWPLFHRAAVLEASARGRAATGEEDGGVDEREGGRWQLGRRTVALKGGRGTAATQGGGRRARLPLTAHRLRHHRLATSFLFLGAAPTSRYRLGHVVTCRPPRARPPVPLPPPRAPPYRPLPSIAAACFRLSRDAAAAELSSSPQPLAPLSPPPLSCVAARSPTPATASPPPPPSLRRVGRPAPRQAPPRQPPLVPPLPAFFGSQPEKKEGRREKKEGRREKKVHVIVHATCHVGNTTVKRGFGPR